MTHWTVSQPAKDLAGSIRADATRVGAILASPAATVEMIAAARALVDKLSADLPKLALELEFAPQLV